MVTQYGNWMICDENPDNENVKALLKESKDTASVIAGIDFPDEDTKYVFKELDLLQKERYGLDINKPYWSAGWKVTV